MIEFEKKIPLTKDEYELLLMNIGKYMPYVNQTNYYFDTDDLAMNKQGVTCRIRLQNGKYKATVKKHKAMGPNCNYEKNLNIKDGLEKNEFVDMGLCLQGQLETERTVLLKSKFCEIVLDRNDYLGYTDYEMEIEYMEGYENSTEQLIEEIAEFLVSMNKIDDTESFMYRLGKSKSKSERFFERKLNIINAQ